MKPIPTIAYWFKPVAIINPTTYYTSVGSKLSSTISTNSYDIYAPYITGWSKLIWTLRPL